MKWFWILQVLGFGAVEMEPNPALEAQLRSHFEAQFQATVGIGFKSFSCAFPKDERLRREFFCHAVDEEDDRFRFHITIDDEGNLQGGVSQPISQLPEQGRELLSGICRDFLSRFDARDWSGLYAGFAGSLQSVVTEQATQEMLAPLRDLAGEVTAIEPQRYANPSENVHLIECTLVGTGGRLTGRFRLQFDETGAAKVDAFLVTPESGTPLQVQLLRESGLDLISSLVGIRAVRIDAPLETIEHLGQSVEGTVSLDDGRSLAIYVEQHKTAYDFSPNDYLFHVIEAAWLIEQQLDTEGLEVDTVDCPHRTVPSGDRMQCQVTLASGDQQAVVLSRRDGEHRMSRPDGP